MNRGLVFMSLTHIWNNCFPGCNLDLRREDSWNIEWFPRQFKEHGTKSIYNAIQLNYLVLNKLAALYITEICDIKLELDEVEVKTSDYTSGILFL